MTVNDGEYERVRRLTRTQIAHDTSIIDALRALRIKRGLSVEDMAERCGVTPSAIVRIESDPSYTLAALRRYAVAVNATVKYEVEEA